MRVLTINTGSSSVKAGLFDIGERGETLLLSASGERLGAHGGRMALQDAAGASVREQRDGLPGHAAALRLLFGWLGDRYPKRLLLGGIYLLRSATVAAFFMYPPTPLTVVLFGAVMGTLWLGVIPLVNGLVVQIFGLRFLSTLTGIAFLSHQAGSFLGAWGGGYLYDLMGSYDLAWKIGVLIGLIAGTAQLLMNDRPTERVLAAEAAAD